MEKRLLIAAVIVAALVLAGAGGLLLKKGEEKVLYVLNYSDYISPDVVKRFEEETGIRVVIDEYEAAEEAWPKLQAGGAGYDLIITAHTYVKLAAEKGLIQKLDKAKIPNLENLDPVIAGHPADPNQDYAVPYMWGTTGIAVLTTCVSDPPETWREFLDPAYLSRYQGRVSLLSEFSETLMAAMIALGYDPSDRASWNEDVVGQAEQLLLQVKPYLAGFYGASQYMQGLASGSLCLAQAWNGDVLVVQEENPNVTYVVPMDGALFWVDYMVIPRDAKHVEEAYMFINFLLRPDVAAENVKYLYYAASIKKELLEQYAEETGDEELMEILGDPAVYPPADAKLIPSPVLDEEMSRLVERARLHVMGGG